MTIVAAALAIALPLGAGALSAWVAPARNVPQSPLSPPRWVFAPVWTLLYACMGAASYLVWRRAGLRSAALTLYAAQLALNVAWSPAFFGLRRPGLALAVLAALDVTAVATLTAFAKVSGPAAALLVPYVAWLAYATALNATLV